MAVYFNGCKDSSWIILLTAVLSKCFGKFKMHKKPADTGISTTTTIMLNAAVPSLTFHLRYLGECMKKTDFMRFLDEGSKNLSSVPHVCNYCIT